MRGIDGAKLVKGVKLHAICYKHGSLLDLELTPAHVDDHAARGRCCRDWPSWASRAICWAIAAFKAHPR